MEISRAEPSSTAVTAWCRDGQVAEQQPLRKDFQGKSCLNCMRYQHRALQFRSCRGSLLLLN